MFVVFYLHHLFYYFLSRSPRIPQQSIFGLCSTILSLLYVMQWLTFIWWMLYNTDSVWDIEAKLIKLITFPKGNAGVNFITVNKIRSSSLLAHILLQSPWVRNKLYITLSFCMGLKTGGHVSVHTLHFIQVHEKVGPCGQWWWMTVHQHTREGNSSKPTKMCSLKNGLWLIK